MLNFKKVAHFQLPMRLWVLFAIALSLFVSQTVWFFAQRSSAVSPTSSTMQSIEYLQSLILQSNENPTLHAKLGLDYLQTVLETGDLDFYERAENSFTYALELDPTHPYAFIGMGQLALSQHKFHEAIVWAEKGRLDNRFAPEPLAILVDAYIETGQYEAAAEVLQELVNTRPNLTAYTRVSYLRELNGDIDGAIEAMTTASQMGPPGHVDTLWAKVHLGNIYFNQGMFAEAEAAYTEVLWYDPTHLHARADLGLLYAIQGKIDEALDIYLPLVDTNPNAEFVENLALIYQLQGRDRRAERTLTQVEGFILAEQAAGMNVDLELAHYYASQNEDFAAQVDLARAVYTDRPTIDAADTLAWALYQNGNYAEAWEYSQTALRLNSSNATFHYHAGVIAEALGDEVAAQEHLVLAEEINPLIYVLEEGTLQTD